jgi:hypothetical protein
MLQDRVKGRAQRRASPRACHRRQRHFDVPSLGTGFGQAIRISRGRNRKNMFVQGDLLGRQSEVVQLSLLFVQSNIGNDIALVLL